MLKLFNLVIVHTPGHHAVADWQSIAGKIEAAAPDIEVRIADNSVPDPLPPGWLAARPSLIFSAGILRAFKPQQGRLYVGQKLSKWQEALRLNQAGVAIPATTVWTRDVEYSSATFGPSVIVKPSRGLKGREVRLLPTETAHHHWKSITRDGETRFLLQRFIDTGARPSHYRVLTGFGIPLYMIRRRAARAEGDQARAPRAAEWRLVSNGSPHIEIVEDAEVLAFARRVGAALPEIPILGCDIVREERSGTVYALEANSFGETWHFSSDTHNRLRQKTGLKLDYYAQFGALDLLAGELVRRVRAEAC